MIQENEILMLIIGMSVFYLILKNQLKFRQIKAWEILMAGYVILLGGWVFTVVEGFLLNEFFNWLEHLCYAVSSVIIMIWIWKLFVGKREE